MVATITFIATLFNNAWPGSIPVSQDWGHELPTAHLQSWVSFMFWEFSWLMLTWDTSLWFLSSLCGFGCTCVMWWASHCLGASSHEKTVFTLKLCWEWGGPWLCLAAHCDWPKYNMSCGCLLLQADIRASFAESTWAFDINSKPITEVPWSS